MLPRDCGSGSVPPSGISASMRPQGATDAPNTDLDSVDDHYLRRRRIQKLRWLGLDEEADRLAAGFAECRAVGAIPETD